jgi:hypothetical protein
MLVSGWQNYSQILNRYILSRYVWSEYGMEYTIVERVGHEIVYGIATRVENHHSACCLASCVDSATSGLRSL